MFDSDGDGTEFGDLFSELVVDSDDEGQTAEEFAKEMRDACREAVAIRESMQSGVPLAERRRLMDLQLGKDFSAQLRRADDWLFEGFMRMGGGDDESDVGDVKRAVFCFQAAEMTDSCHGTLWPHLKYQSHKKSFDPEQGQMLSIGLSGKYDCFDQLEAANRALGIGEARNVVPPRQTGSLDLDSLERVPASSASAASGIKGSILSAGGLPAVVCVEQRDETAAVALHTRCLWRDKQGALLLEVLFMYNTRETWTAKGALEPLTLQELQEEVGLPRQKVVCDQVELRDLLEELRANSAKVGVACHMRRREGFACGKAGEEAVSARVLREPLEVSFLQLSAPKSAAFLAALEAKARGNARFADGSLAEALELYREALQGFLRCAEHGSKEVRDEAGKVHANRAECHLRQECWPEALAEADAALEADVSNVKAFFRRAKAHEAMGEVSRAVADLREVLRVDPKSQQARVMLARLRPEGVAETPPPSSRGPVAATPPPLRALAGNAARRAASSAPSDQPPGAPAAPAAWATGLSPSMQREWLVDCYRLRVDDQYAWGGGNLRGLYAQAAGGGGSSSEDFLLFCKLAVRHGVIPDGWDWAAFLATAKGLLRHAFEKSDAQEKYGQENVFAVVMGGRSLRYTAEVVYGSSCMSMESSEVEDEVEGKLRAGRFRDEFYEEIGGVAVWRLACLAPEPRRGGKGLETGRGASSKGAGRGRLCRNYQAGHCVYGERCHFLHQGPQGAESRAPLCRFWQSGGCSYGGRCRYRHGCG